MELEHTHPYPDDIWLPRPFTKGTRLYFEYGPLALRLERTAEEGHLGIKRDRPDDTCHVEVDPDDWQISISERFAFDQSWDVLRPTPVLPERSVVVRPDHALKIPPGEDVLFFVSIPLSIRLLASGNGREVALSTVPTMVLSNTWFGDPTEGELCFALKTTARRSLGEIIHRPWRVIAPITMHNRADSNLDLQRLCIQVKHLGIFLGRSFLWTHPIDAVHRGGDHPIEFNFGADAPAFEPIRQTFAQPREVRKESFLKRSFHTLRNPGSLFN
ncbi:MAG: hypothetical protein EA425_05175 [Puniceicoccaceae bacterium]|nr:MAG: hypothetical protein EA425_05175 [Puniceicoccaceae bacterium]